MKPRLLLATGNSGKLAEFRALLSQTPFELLDLSAFPELRLPEEGDDYRANAVAKAQHASRQSGLPALADDSGLEVRALGGAPGPHSARYGGPGLDARGRVNRLLAELGPGGERRARFVCFVALALPDGSLRLRRGVCEGRLLEAAAGDAGFGYDPIFQPEGHTVSMAQLEAAQKNRISHRARAIADLKPALLELAEGRNDKRVR